MSASGGELPNAKLLRLLRLGRAVKLFKTLRSLNRLITAVSKAVVPVSNAFFLLFIIAAIYAILGTNFFGNCKDTPVCAPEYFSDFATSLFTMFQVLLIITSRPSTKLWAWEFCLWGAGRKLKMTFFHHTLFHRPPW